MILHCNFEELQALSTGADAILGEAWEGPTSVLAAPVEGLSEVALLQPRLTASLSLATLEEQRSVRRAVGAICDVLHQRMDQKVVEYHPAHEEAVALYFDYAHAYGVLRRLDEIGAEMTAMIELITGAKPTEESTGSVAFPD